MENETPFSRFQNNGDTQNRYYPRQNDNILNLLSINLTTTYSKYNPNFSYTTNMNPRRVITNPSEAVSNNNWDNCENEYIIYVNDIIGSHPEHQYTVLDLLGQGTFGQVVKCQSIKNPNHIVAIKILKNKPAYLNQGLLEIRILQMLNTECDPNDQHALVRLSDYFVFRHHLCLVFELLSFSLFDLIQQNNYKGLSLTTIRALLIQILDSLKVLYNNNIVHCDLKPENILLRSSNSCLVKLIDFGSACFENQTVYSYIQSRHYRSPEVLLGYPYDSAIDMWSLGCVTAELFLGLPLFPGTSEFNQLYRIVDMLGNPPIEMLQKSKNTLKFFNVNEQGEYTLKTEEEYFAENGLKYEPSKKYFNYRKLDDIIQHYTYKKGLLPQEITREAQLRIAMTDFLKGLLKIDPKNRWTPEQAKFHPFIVGKPLEKTFVPNTKPKAKPPIRIPPIPLNMILLNSNPYADEFYPEPESYLLQKFQDSQMNVPMNMYNIYPPMYNNSLNMSPPDNNMMYPPINSGSGISDKFAGLNRQRSRSDAGLPQNIKHYRNNNPNSNNNNNNNNNNNTKKSFNNTQNQNFKNNSNQNKKNTPNRKPNQNFQSKKKFNKNKSHRRRNSNNSNNLTVIEPPFQTSGSWDPAYSNEIFVNAENWQEDDVNNKFSRVNFQNQNNLYVDDNFQQQSSSWGSRHELDLGNTDRTTGYRASFSGISGSYFPQHMTIPPNNQQGIPTYSFYDQQNLQNLQRQNSNQNINHNQNSNSNQNNLNHNNQNTNQNRSLNQNQNSKQNKNHNNQNINNTNQNRNQNNLNHNNQTINQNSNPNINKSTPNYQKNNKNQNLEKTNIQKSNGFSNGQHVT